jgi:hypothetical protein
MIYGKRQIIKMTQIILMDGKPLGWIGGRYQEEMKNGNRDSWPQLVQHDLHKNLTMNSLMM